MSGITLLGLLGVVFVTLKLAHVISWSWWWVTLPFWCGLAVALIFILIAALANAMEDVYKRQLTT